VSWCLYFQGIVSWCLYFQGIVSWCLYFQGIVSWCLLQAPTKHSLKLKIPRPQPSIMSQGLDARAPTEHWPHVLHFVSTDGHNPLVHVHRRVTVTGDQTDTVTHLGKHMISLEGGWMVASVGRWMLNVECWKMIWWVNEWSDRWRDWMLWWVNG
jgi:hypothetical protein